MWQKTANFKHLLNYLRDQTYHSLPPELFDRHLWFYKEVEEFLHRLELMTDQDMLLLYEDFEDDQVVAIASVQKKGADLSINFDAFRPDHLNGLMPLLTSRFPNQKVVMKFCKPEIAARAASLLQTTVIPGKVKYYTCQASPLSDLPVKEMGRWDEYPIQWSNYEQFLFLGQRLFGLRLDGRVRAMCGLLQLTAFQTQIVAVETFDKADRRKGYAKAVASFALQEGLKDAPFVTWSTSVDNMASCKTAESLGMKPYYALYEVHSQIQEGNTL